MNNTTPERDGGYCSSCGHARRGNDAYCSNCGNSTSTAGSGRTSRMSAWAPVAIAAAFTIMAASIAVLALGSGNESSAFPVPSTTTTLLSSTTTEPSTTMTVAVELDEKALADTYGDAVFKITTEGCELVGTGTGFAIDKNHIVTNKHVVDNDTTPTITARDGSVYDGRVVGWRENPDMAVIWIDSEVDTYLEWSDSDQLGEGEHTVSLGYPLPDHDFSVAPGVVLSFDDERGHRAAIRSDAQLDMGNSGGPTLLADGRVAGVVTAMDLNLSGYQFVPIIIPSNDIVEKVEWILENPSRPTVDCDEIVAANAEPEPTTTTTTPTVAPPPPSAPAESFYTVILASMQQRNASFDDAMARAQDLADEFDVTMHVLDSNQYSSLSRGYWVVYAGKYSRADAKDIAQMLRNYGFDAYAKQVSQ